MPNVDGTDDLLVTSNSNERVMEEGGTGAPAAESDPHIKDTKGLHLYNVLGLDKKATEDEIKKAYRKLALRYHPDKNLGGDPETTEKFKEVNYANGILSNPKKRRVYDEMGDTGLKLMEQFGEDNEAILTWMLKPWFKWVFFGFGLLTCGFCCCFCGCICCCKCCCNFCCGKYVPKEEDGAYQTSDDANDLSEEDRPPVITLQPGSTEEPTTTTIITELPSQGPNGEEPVRPAVIAMPPPPTSGYGSLESSH